jgi:hypothetical protein
MSETDMLFETCANDRLSTWVDDIRHEESHSISDISPMRPNDGEPIVVLVITPNAAGARSPRRSHPHDGIPFRRRAAITGIYALPIGIPVDVFNCGQSAHARGKG